MCLDTSRENNRHFDRERWYPASQAAKSSKFSGAGHSVSVSRPKDVAAVIQEAASNARWPFEKLNVKGVRHSSGVRPVWRTSGQSRDFQGVVQRERRALRRWIGPHRPLLL